MQVLHTLSPQTAPSVAPVYVCASVGKKGNTCSGRTCGQGKTNTPWYGWERQVCECVWQCTVCLWLWGYRPGWGLVQSSRQCSRPRLDLAKAQINTNMNSSFLPAFPYIANTHLWCGSEGESHLTQPTVFPLLCTLACVCRFCKNMHFCIIWITQANSWFYRFCSAQCSWIITAFRFPVFMFHYLTIFCLLLSIFLYCNQPYYISFIHTNTLKVELPRSKKEKFSSQHFFPPFLHCCALSRQVGRGPQWSKHSRKTHFLQRAYVHIFNLHIYAKQRPLSSSNIPLHPTQPCIPQHPPTSSIHTHCLNKTQLRGQSEKGKGSDRCSSRQIFYRTSCKINSV